ncbi:MAG: hypothetical protein HY562_05455 [Ignavibacteriales bacterium]|nr:hypothetical protein [Ignavibacteriales bacterium]
MIKIFRITKLCMGGFSIVAMGCSGLQMQSVWNHKEFKADAVLSEWPDTVWNEKDGLRFGLMNDNEYLYFALTAVKLDQRRQIMMRGLTIWFDPLAREKKTIGFRYPVGGGLRRPGEGDPGSAFASGMAEFEYTSPLEEALQRVPIVAGKGVEVKISNTQELLVYELKVPLAPSSDHPYSIESRAGSMISIGLEIRPFEGGVGPTASTQPSGRRRGGPPSSDPSPIGGGGRGEATNVWATVQLALPKQ